MAKRATAALVAAGQGVASALQDADLATLPAKMDQLIRLMDESLHLQRVALLDEGHILRFTAGLHQIALSLPDAQDDFVQRVIVKTRTFYEARLLATVQTMGLIGSGSTVCDIGANIGNHSVYFGKVLGARRIIAFEPQPHCHATLCRNLDLNRLVEATAYNCLVGPVSGRGDVTRFNPRNHGATSFTPADGGAVPMIALDDLIEAEELQGLSFIKIDVEGMQTQVLSGARAVLARFRPALWVEALERDGGLAPVLDLVADLGYTAQAIGPSDFILTVKS